MACYFPWVPKGAQVVRPLSCGQCHGCRLERSRQWAVRCLNEASLHDENCFITLTLKDESFSLEPLLFTLFMKRLRARIAPRRVRFFMCGEYGELHSRPHYHACLFGFNFPDRVYFKSSPSGSKLYRSALLESLWPYGLSSVGDVTFESAAYVARYVMKKIKDGEALHGIFNVETGEIVYRVKEYGRMSLGRGGDRGIGYRWIKRFRSDVYPAGKIVVNGVECRPPRYYDKVYRASDAGGWMKLSQKRSEELYENIGEMAPGRLESRELVSKARLSLSKRKI